MALNIENEPEQNANDLNCEMEIGAIQQDVKNEPAEETVIQEMLMEEMPENKDIQRVKENPNRRRSMRSFEASTRKIKPPKYDEIFNCYKRKEFKECIIYIDLVAESTKDCIEYQILRATCLVNLNIKLGEAHRILDDVLKQKPDNSYCVYAKGLAYYQECRWQECITFFDKAIAMDPKSMQRAEVLKNLAQTEMENEKSDDIEVESNEEQMDVENEDSQDSSDSVKRFACDLCDKRFGKKFNLDRHNKSIHNRETPFIPPLQRNHSRKSGPAKSSEEIEIKDEQLEESVIKEEPEESPVKSAKKHSVLKLNFFGKKKKKTKHSKNESKSLPNGMARCNVCRKVYSRGSLARHQVIHTGNKSFECTTCGKAFYQKSDLQRHETIHSDVFDYECELCDKKFRIKKNLQVHNKRHHSK